MVDGIFPQKAIGCFARCFRVWGGEVFLLEILFWGWIVGGDMWFFWGSKSWSILHIYYLHVCVCVCSLNIFWSTSSYDSLMLLETSWNRDFTICIYWSIIIRYDQLFVSLEAAKPSGFRCFIWRHQSQKHPRAGGKRCEVDAERGLYILISGDS